jgi:hypothetical protein
MYVITVWGKMQTAAAVTEQLCMKTLVLWGWEFGNGAFFFGCEALRYPSKRILFEIIKDRVGII